MHGGCVEVHGGAWRCMEVHGGCIKNARGCTEDAWRGMEGMKDACRVHEGAWKCKEDAFRVRGGCIQGA